MRDCICGKGLTPHEAMMDAVEMTHRREVAKLEMQLVLYRSLLEQHGIEPPNSEGKDLLQMWRDSAAVISTASEMVANLGTAKELISQRLGAPL